MPNDEWFTFSEATQLVANRLGCSVGRSQAIVRAAQTSGEVRQRRPAPLLAADDGLMGYGAPEDQINSADFLDWLDRNHAANKPKGKGGRPPRFDRDVVAAEVQRLMNHHGEFSPDDPEWNAQARLVEALRQRFGEASDSTLEDYLREPLAAWRTEKAAPKT